MPKSCAMYYQGKTAISQNVSDLKKKKKSFLAILWFHGFWNWRKQSSLKKPSTQQEYYGEK